MFKGEGPRQPFIREIFVFGLSEKNHHHMMFRCGFEHNEENIVKKKNMVWGINEADHFSFKKMYHNKNLSQFIFTTDHSFHVAYENNLKLKVKGKKSYKTFESWNNPKVTKNGFQQENLLVLAANEAEDMFALEYIEKNGKLGKIDLKDYQTTNRKLMDILKTQEMSTTVVLGAPLNNQPFILVNSIFEKDVNISYVAGKFKFFIISDRTEPV